MLRYLPRNPAMRQFTIAQLSGIGVGAFLMLTLISYVFIMHH